LSIKKIILFASGAGSNVENIVRYFADNPLVAISVVLTNNKNAKVIERCNKLKVNALYFNKHAFTGSTCVLELIKEMNPDLIVLAGFLWKIPEDIVAAFPNKIINIHPALLPKYGGKGMYGMHVHQAVKAQEEVETGITIHYVNDKYDEGAVINQVATTITLEDSAATIAKKVQELERQHFPKTIERLLFPEKGN